MIQSDTTQISLRDFVEATPVCFIDFEKIQVAPQNPSKEDEFRSLSLSERQALLNRLIDRVKSL